MKTLTIFTCILLHTGLSNAQSNSAFEKGNSVISAGIGIGNIFKSFLEEAYNYPGGTYNVSTRGPYVFIYEYAFTNRISAGVVTGYSETIGKFAGFGEQFTETLTNFSVLAISNFHFGKFKKFDPYAGGGLGYFHFNYNNDKPGIINSRVPGAFGYSIQLGAKYYFTKHAGLYAEAGYIGGSFGQLGIAVKF